MTVVPSLGFVGVGKVGETLARLLYARGYVIAAVYNRHTKRAADMVQHLGEGVRVVETVEDVMRLSDLTLLTITDDSVEAVAAAIQTGDLSGKAVVHTSGVHEAAVLGSLKARGAIIGSLHPVYPFADVEQSILGLPGSVFGVQAETVLLERWLQGIITALDGQGLVIPAGQKALYHSALVFLSNYSVTLYAIAQQLLTHIGADSDVASTALNTLMHGMVDNLRIKGIPDALTGPLVRGDIGTIGAHWSGLMSVDASLADLYLRLALHSLALVEARGRDIKPIEEFLRKKMDDADNHT